jgi:hypothetical protein
VEPPEISESLVVFLRDVPGELQRDSAGPGNAPYGGVFDAGFRNEIFAIADEFSGYVAFLEAYAAGSDSYDEGGFRAQKDNSKYDCYHNQNILCIDIHGHHREATLLIQAHHCAAVEYYSQFQVDNVAHKRRFVK